MLRRTLLTCLLAISTLHAQTQEPAHPKTSYATPVKRSAPDTRVFGLRLGAVPSVPECHRDSKELGPGRYQYSGTSYQDEDGKWVFFIADRCYENHETYSGPHPTPDNYGEGPTMGPVRNGDITFRFPITGPDSAAFGGDKIRGEIIEGKLENLLIETSGAKAQIGVLRQLVNKYGKPSSSLRTHLQNGFGAKYEGIEAHWIFTNLIVDFYGIGDKVDEGYVSIYTPKYRAAQKVKENNVSHSRPL